MVSGCATAPAYTPRVSQCAETHSTDLGRGSCCASARQARWNSLSSIAFIGLPCPRNSAGMRMRELARGRLLHLGLGAQVADQGLDLLAREALVDLRLHLRERRKID